MSEQQQQEQQHEQQGQAAAATTPGEGVPQQERVTISVAPPDSQQNQEAPTSSRFLSTVGRVKEGLLERPIRYDIISILFALLILGGGIYGYISKESVPSLVAGVVFAVLLAFGTYLEGARRNPYPLIITLIVLGAQFAYRYGQSGKFMPSGLFAILSFIMVARHCFIVYLKRQRTLEETSGEA